MSAPNPIKAAREARGISRPALAMALGLSTSGVGAVESGHLAALPESWRDVLVAADFDFDTLASAYQDWRRERGAELLKAATGGEA